ncbi:hypothetical protein [Devosia sp. RR2S18]|uniref:hypothetical protein n=1 Tax=Devosia rhizosphaerae TaxID=3049774 RepID=UPI00254031F7|nr:hypothetical protein [Devosia sp. RR2S18]WIJ27025.1 hypothetical protein QOV41_09885 [Devosia sp. RR2S18]
MHRRLILAACLLLVTSASAKEWKYEGGSVPIAYSDTASAQFQFACRGGDLAMGFWVREPHSQVAGASSMSVAITADPEPESRVTAASSSFAQEMPLVHMDGSSVIVRGPVAREWARIAQRARNLIRIAFVRTGPQDGLEAFDATVFGAKGSSGSIQKVLDQCR